MVRFAIESRSARQTKAWGRRLAALLTGGELLGLAGDLGAGKTCFVKGLARGLGLDEKKILSPSFTMIQEHRGRLALFHIDLYRLEAARLDDLGLREYLFSEGVAAVEWFERLRDAPAIDCLSIHFGYAGANTRLIELSAESNRYCELIKRLKARFG